MDMQVIIDYIVEYAAIWAPALTAIIGAVAVFIKAFTKIKEAVKEIKDEKTIKELKEQVEIENMLLRQVRDELRVTNEKLYNVKDYGKNKETVKDE